MLSPRLRNTLTLLAIVAALVVVFIFPKRNPDRQDATQKSAIAQPSAAPSLVSSASGEGAGSSDSRRELLERLAYAQAWDGTLPPAMAAFRAWTIRHRESPPTIRAALEPEGVALARARREEMRSLIINDPARALAVTVPAIVRQSLPPAVLQELETRHAGRGDFALQASQPEAGMTALEPSLRRIVYLDGQTFNARAYGRREPQITKEGASLHGIALDGEFALHESPLRILDPGEIIAEQVDPVCAACAAGFEQVETNAAANLTVIDRVAAEGRLRRVHEDELSQFEENLTGAEDLPGPRVQPLITSTTPISAPPRAAEAPTPHTVGTKQVLVIRVDFSDFPGEPMSLSAAQNVVDGLVKPFLEDGSYGQTSLITTVSNQVYRLPRTGITYATTNDRTGLHTDARNAASANFTMANFDRIVVLFPNIGASRVPGSQITFGGLANVIGTNIWINGSANFSYATVSHEFGHTYGLLHSNLWRVTDGNAASAKGVTLEYGDPFDMMGSTSATGVSRDSRHHFGMWGKNRLGWLPDAAVTSVNQSGTYRIHRFDHRGASPTQPQALRIFRDGVRWYWIGLRQNFSAGAPRSDGAYIVWGYNQLLQSQLLDLTTTGTSASDAALALGATFTDTAYGITIKPIARGGNDPAQWLDVEITVPGAPPNVITAWGREGATFYNNETGADQLPSPETNVPIGLTHVRSITAGNQHALALKLDGTVVAWGNHSNGQIAVPNGLTDVQAIAAGGNVSGAVRSDGTVQLWGEATNGLTTPPAGLLNVKELAIGFTHALALKTDGTIVAWGDNGSGQTNVPASLTNVIAIAAGDRLSVALRGDGTVVRWGANFTNIAVPAGLQGVTQIACRNSHILALKNDGTVVAWGNNANNQSDVPPGLNKVVAVAAGGFHSLALKDDGTIAAWGSALGGKTNVPRSMPRASAIACSQQSSFAFSGPNFRITTQPQQQSVIAGSTATFRIEATGSGSLTYQWRKDNVPIAGAIGSTYTIPNISSSHAGSYDVIVTDSGISFQSTKAQLTAVPPGSRIANLSIRTLATAGGEPLIVGFVVGGSSTSGPKPLLVRAVGPTLARFGISDALGDPKLELFNANSVKLMENDDWSASNSALFTSVGAFSLDAGSHDAAIYSATTAIGAYSAQVSPVGNASGVVLAEIYDVTSDAAFIGSTPRLINVSARTFSGSGADVLIAGFAIAGPVPKTVLIRGIGPSLTQFGVAGVLTDPKLELFNSQQVRTQQNDNWGGTAALVAAFSSVGAFPLATDSRDAALLATLQPGTYTAQVSGVGDAVGVALVEIYEMP